ncbi:MAG TPA: histidine kinase [Trichocoleus sp.]|jgi:phage-related protein
MPNTIQQDHIKEKIESDLQKAKQEGQLRADRVREIVRSAVSEATKEVKTGSSEIRSIIKEVASTVFHVLQDRGKNAKEEVTASIEGVIDGISQVRRDSIVKTETEIKKLQAQVNDSETELHQDIDQALTEIETTGQQGSSDLKVAIESAINNLKESEEGVMLQKRYAQLQAQLSILKANLAARYGDRFEEIQQHLDDSKAWYENARQSQPEGTTLVQQKQTEVEQKMGEAGSALARREKRVKAMLRDLLHSMTHAFDDRSSK